MTARRPLTVVQLTLRTCSRTFGTAPCNATGTPCWNTDATCRFRSALDLTATQVLTFVPEVAWQWIDAAGAFQPSLALPALRSYQVAPTVLNVASGDKDVQPLGYRAVCSVEIADFPWNDVGTDPYLSARTSVQGTFWGKLLARHPFYPGASLAIYEGFEGDALAAMTVRRFEVTRISRSRDGVSIEAKDPLWRLSDTDVTYPPLSPGELARDLTSAATSIRVAGALPADYPAPGIVRIGDELIAFGSVGDQGGNITLNDLTRGAHGTTAAAAGQGDRVQLVKSWTATRFDVILADVLTSAGIDPTFVPVATWATEADEWRPEFLFDVWETQPRKALDVARDLVLQAMVNVWWDERAALIRMQAQRPAPSPPLLTDDAHILAGSLSVTDHPDRRVTAVYVYYGLRSRISDPGDARSYARAELYVNDREQAQYGGQPIVVEIFAPYIASSPIALTLGNVYAGRFRNTRREIVFDTAEPIVWTGDHLLVRHFLVAGPDGLPLTGSWLVTQADPSQHGARYRYVAEDNDMVGFLWGWVGEGADFAGASAIERETIGFLTDDDGLLPDGSASNYGWL